MVLAHVNSTVFFEDAVALLHVVFPEAFVVGIVNPDHFAKAGAFSVEVGAGKLDDAGPDFDAVAVLEVIQPLTGVHFTCRPLIFTFAIPLIPGPVSRIHTSIYLTQAPYPKSLVIAPLPFKFSPVNPSHRSLSVSQSSQPLAIINGAISILVLMLTDTLF